MDPERLAELYETRNWESEEEEMSNETKTKAPDMDDPADALEFLGAYVDRQALTREAEAAMRTVLKYVDDLEQDLDEAMDIVMGGDKAVDETGADEEPVQGGDA